MVHQKAKDFQEIPTIKLILDPNYINSNKDTRQEFCEGNFLKEKLSNREARAILDLVKDAETRKYMDWTRLHC